MTAADLTSQGMPDGELLGVVALVLIPLALIWLRQTVRDHKARTNERNRPVEYEASPYGPMRRFRNDLCMVATCHGTKAVDLGAGWIVCTDHARSLIGKDGAA